MIKFVWIRVKFFWTCALWDIGRFLGLPLAIDPRDGFPDRAILPQVVAIQIAGLAKVLDPEFRPVQGSKAGLKIIFRATFGPYVVRLQLWRLRRRLSKMTGVKFRTDRGALAFLDFLNEQLATHE